LSVNDTVDSASRMLYWRDLNSFFVHTWWSQQAKAAQEKAQYELDHWDELHPDYDATMVDGMLSL